MKLIESIFFCLIYRSCLIAKQSDSVVPTILRCLTVNRFLCCYKISSISWTTRWKLLETMLLYSNEGGDVGA